jgi:DNA-binding PadR family transcriptional regulator
MLVKDPKYRKHISKYQLRLLLIIFKFRFVSTEYLSSHFKKDKSTIYERLLVLEKQGYVHKDYDSSCKIRQRPAVYSLTTKGIKYLRNSDVVISENALRNMYKNKTASLELIDHSLDVFKLYLQIRNQYPDKFDIFTKSELSIFNDFIRPLPDLYLRRFSKRSAKPGYQLETIEAGTMTWIIRKRLRAHQEFYEDNDTWEDKYPSLLLICGNKNTEKRIQRIVSNSYFDFEIYTTTQDRLNSKDTKIWLKEYDYNWDDEIKFIGL